MWLGTLALLALAPAVTSRCSVESPRNIVIICVDTVRYDTFYLPERSGIPDEFSPWLARGTQFTRAQSTSSWTYPAVASALTGLYPAAHGAGRFSVPVPHLGTDAPSPLQKEVRTLPEMLAQRYESRAFVANSWIGPETLILKGFADVQQLASAEAFEGARRWLLASKGRPAPKPYLLYLHLMQAHDDHIAELALVEKTAADVPSQFGEAILRSSPGDTCRDSASEGCTRYRAYAAAVLQQRRQIASILSAVYDSEGRSSTDVFVFSDHGEEFHDHDAEERARGRDPRDIYGTGHGHSMYQEILHVPLIVWRPELQGSKRTDVVSLADIAPTVAKLALATSEERGWDGINLFGEVRARSIVSAGIAYGPQQAAAIKGNLKVIHWRCPEESRLLDLDADQQEKLPRPVGEMAEGLNREAVKATQPLAEIGTEMTLTPEQLRQLQAIGYLNQVGRRPAPRDSCTPTPRPSAAAPRRSSQ